MTQLHNQSQIPNIQPNDVPLIGLNNTTNVPVNHSNSDTFLQNMVHTGFQVRIPLPIAADAGPVPLFAYRVSPVTWFPDVRNSPQYPHATAIDNTNYLTQDTVGKQWMAKYNSMLNVVPYNDVEVHIVGTESPHSIMTKLFRFHRVDMVYSLRFGNSYTSSGIIMVVPVKTMPRGVLPFVDAASGGATASAAMNNSLVLADLSKSREIKFVYPYEYPIEYQDFTSDYIFSKQYASQVAPNASNRYDNWFVVMARGTLTATDNVSHLDMYIDHAFSKFSLHTPLVPWGFASREIVPIYLVPGNSQNVLYSSYKYVDMPSYNPVTPPPPPSSVVLVAEDEVETTSSLTGLMKALDSSCHGDTVG